MKKREREWQDEEEEKNIVVSSRIFSLSTRKNNNNNNNYNSSRRAKEKTIEKQISFRLDNFLLQGIYIVSTCVKHQFRLDIDRMPLLMNSTFLSLIFAK